MDRTEFEWLRGLTGKTIDGPIRLRAKEGHAPELFANAVPIENSEGIPLLMGVSYNPDTGKKTVNVSVRGVGPVCRLDVDGPRHSPAGGSHKHAVQTPSCSNPGRNLPKGVLDRPDLSGKSIQEVVDEMCRLGNIAGSPRVELPTWAPEEP